MAYDLLSIIFARWRLRIARGAYGQCGSHLANVSENNSKRWVTVLTWRRYALYWEWTVYTAVQWQNANAKFDSVVWRHYLGEVKTFNVYISVRQIYSG